MSEFLETLKARMVDAQKRLLAAQQKAQVSQAEFQSAAQEFNAWQTLVNLETTKEQAKSGSGPAQTVVPVAQPTAQPPIANKSESNKTEAVRELLRQHPGGITPGEAWRRLESLLGNRAYLYSILKRLRDRGDAMEKRGKYFPRPKPEENRNQEVVQ